VTLAGEVRRTLSGIEVINMSCACLSSSKEMTSIAELNFSASLDWNIFELVQRF
jgi:hypothetical protein